MARRTVAQMAHDLYADEELAQAVLADVHANGTAGRIESGELVLPSPHDAAGWFRRETGKAKEVATTASNTQAIDELRAEVMMLRDQLSERPTKGG